MTEEEWVASEEPLTMLDFLGTKASARKLRLLSLECCRNIPSLCESEEDREEARRAIDALDRWAEGLLPIDDLVVFGKTIKWFPGPRRRESKRGLFCLYLATEHRVVVSSAKSLCDESSHFISATSLRMQSLRKSYKTIDEYRQARHPYATAEKRFQQALIRDIFGNPFHPITFLPEWRTSTVLTLAQQMYESRDFSAMPILADALADAGCEDEAMLMHCRAETSHCRGCHVVDAILNKS